MLKGLVFFSGVYSSVGIVNKNLASAMTISITWMDLVSRSSSAVW